MAGSRALLRQFPLLLPQNRQGTAYEGFVTAQGRDFHIRILLPEDLQLKNARVECSWSLKKILHRYQHILKQRLHSCPDLVSFMMELKTVLEIALKNTQDLHVPRPPEYYSCLVRDLEILGWNKVAYVDTGLTTVKLKAEDSCGRQHLMTLKLNAKVFVVMRDRLLGLFKPHLAFKLARQNLSVKCGYPTEAPDCLVDFPVQFAISWMPQNPVNALAPIFALAGWVVLQAPGVCPAALAAGVVSVLPTAHLLGYMKNSLLDIYNQFLAALESLKGFWDTLDEIDGKTWVLEPENPTRSATARRIAIGNNVSVNVEVHPHHPNMLPECYFLGADHAVAPLRAKLNNNMHLWDPEISLLQNLKDLLEIDFPSRAVLEKSDFAQDCGICYAYRLDGAAPDHVCDEPRCAQPFHQACLYEWLQGLPTSRQSFNVIFGECPYCNKPLTLKSSTKKL